MKKVILLVLSLVITVSFGACAKKEEAAPIAQNETAADHTAEDTAQAAAEQKLLHLNETAELGNFEFVITAVDFVDYYSTSAANTDYDTGHRPAGGDVFIRVDYRVKNISKVSQTTPLSCMRADYNDGYIFTPYRSYRGVSELSTGVENPAEMRPLSDPVSCRTYIEVPEEVQTSGNDLYIDIYLSYGEKPDAVYAVRPLDDQQKEALYQQGIAYLGMGTGRSCKNAMTRFAELGDYKDSAALLITATEKMSVLFGDTDYLLEHKDDYRRLTGSEISSIISGEWMVSWDGMQQWSFHGNGTLDDHAGHDRTWRVEGDHLLITTAKIVTWYCEMRQVYDGGYFLVYEQEISGQMKTVARTMYPKE